MTTIIAASDMITAELLTAAKQHHLVLPDQLSLIGIEDTIICDLTAPTLTSMTQDFRTVGQQSVNRLLGQANHAIAPVVSVERDSHHVKQDATTRFGVIASYFVI